MSCQITQSPQILPSQQPVQNPQNSHYSRASKKIAAGVIVASSMFIGALAVNSYIRTNIPLISNLLDAQTIISTLSSVNTPIFGGLSGGLMGISLCAYATIQDCRSGHIYDYRPGHIAIMGTLTALGAAIGAVGGTALYITARYLPIN